MDAHGEGEDEGEGDDKLDARVVGDAVDDWFELVASACRAVLAAILSSTLSGGVCGIEPGGKRRKKLSKGFGRVFASCSYCRNEAMSSSIKHP